MTTLAILTALRDALRALPLDPVNDPAGETLFDVVELAANKQLSKQLAALLIGTKKRACLVVPLAVRRLVPDQSGGLSVLGTKSLEVAVIYSDVAYFKASQAVTFGGENNLGLFTMDEQIEAALTGKAISPYGGIIPGDSDPLTLTDSEEKGAAGRSAWLMQLFVPCGLIEAAVVD